MAILQGMVLEVLFLFNSPSIMTKKFLLTSFDTWLPHQSSNSSDDLLKTLLPSPPPKNHLIFLRHLPVDLSRASERTLKAIAYHQPDTIICCGMAESRHQLSLEARARGDLDQFHTPIDLSQLITQLDHTHISYDGGKFVCEGLYYQILKHSPQSQCLFLHVPLVNSSNRKLLQSDLQKILAIFPDFPDSVP